MLSVCPKAAERFVARLAYHPPRLARAVAGGVCALSLFVGVHGAALAYSPDGMILTPAAQAAAARDASLANAIQRAGRSSTSARPGQSGGGEPNPSTPSQPSALSTADSTPGAPFPAGLSGNVTQAAAAPAPPAVIKAPTYSQFDGSVWASSNCGPTSLSMALGALGIKVDQLALRQLANTQMHDANPDDGTSWDALAAAARQNSASISGLYDGSKYHTWSIDDLKNQLAQGHPVVILTHYRDLPNHATSTYTGDHYVVAIGIDLNGNIVYNDPAAVKGTSITQTMTPDQLQKAWSETNFGLFHTAMAISK